MENTDSGFQTLVAEVQIEVRQIDRHHQTFVRQYAIREAGDIEIRVLLQRFFSKATGIKQFYRQVGIVQRFGWRNEDLLKAWQAVNGHRTEAVIAGWHCAPAQNLKALA